MIKRTFLILAFLAGLLSPAYSAGTIPFSLSQQFDNLGKPLNGCKLYIYAAGTTTPQNAYSDSALTLPLPNPLTCDSAGRLPQFFLADGSVKVRLTSSIGVNQGYGGAGTMDNILVVGASSGGGGGGSVDATTIFQTGDVKYRYGTGAHTGWVRYNGRTIGSSTSGATERANADCQALFEYLWATDANLTVSTGRGASASVDWAANKAITLPDARSRALAGMGDMGNSDNGLLSIATFTSGTALTLGGQVGASRRTLSLAQLPTGITSTTGSPITVAPTTANKNFPVTAGPITFVPTVSTGTNFAPRSGSGAGDWDTASSMSTSGAVTSTSNNTGGTAFDTVSPYMVVTVYGKL